MGAPRDGDKKLSLEELILLNLLNLLNFASHMLTEPCIFAAESGFAAYILAEPCIFTAESCFSHHSRRYLSFKHRNDIKQNDELACSLPNSIFEFQLSSVNIAFILSETLFVAVTC